MLTTEQKRSLEKFLPIRNFTDDAAALIAYEIDAGFDRATPDAIFYPESSGQISKIVHWAKQNGFPIIARGAGTGLAGGAVATQGGIILSFARMNNISAVDTIGRSVTAEAGTVNLALDAAVKAHGLYYPPDPSSQRSSTIGGNISTNAGGPHCFKYGVTTNYVTGLEIIIADGSVVQLGGRAYDYPEYDFCALLTGGEGTLGIVARADLRLIRNPTGVKTLMVAFDSEEQAGIAVSAVIAAGLTPATLELMDQSGMKMIEQFANADLPIHAGAALIAEVDGYPNGLDAQLEEVADLFTENGGFDLRIAQTESERERIWYGRKSAAGAISRLAPSYYLTDVTVPRSHLGEVIAKINQICTRYELSTASFFHAGDGNLHPLILCNTADTELMQRVHQAGKEIIQLCIEREGSITGEHGVGMEKRAHMATMFSAEELSALRDIKQVFDPKGILNPGKVLPDQHAGPTYTPPKLPAERTFSPNNAKEAAAALRAIGEAKKRAWIGSAALPTTSSKAFLAENNADYWLSTSRLCGVRKLATDDLYVTVGAGTSVGDLIDYLNERQRQSALVSPWPDATIGTLLASNINAPWRMRYGSLRDNMLCCQVALADGRTLRAGRPVVKNVAGYDLPKLFVGAHGTLGLMTDVTLKLTPIPRHKRTLCIPVTDLQTGLAWAGKLAPQMLMASGILLCETKQLSQPHTLPYTLVYTAEGMFEDVEAELGQVEALLGQLGAPPAFAIDQSSNDLWQGFVGSATSSAMLLRVGLPPCHLAILLDTLPTELLLAAEWLLDIASGFAYVKVDLSRSVGTSSGAKFEPANWPATTWLTTIRQHAQAREGYAIVLAMPSTHAEQIDRWGYKPDSLGLMSQLKARWDPHGVLNPGAFRLVVDGG